MTRSAIIAAIYAPRLRLNGTPREVMRPPHVHGVTKADSCAHALITGTGTDGVRGGPRELFARDAAAHQIRESHFIFHSLEVLIERQFCVRTVLAQRIQSSESSFITNMADQRVEREFIDYKTVKSIL